MSHSDYQAFYHLLETFSRYWTDKEFTGGTNRYSPPLDSRFDKKATAIQAFNHLFELAKNIPLWLISYNDRSYPSVETFETLLRATGRKISTDRYRYSNSRGGKGSVKGSHEILFVAKMQ
jgi:adenine-specific DNA methylase